MPIRQDVQGSINPGELDSYRATQAATPQFQNPQLGEDAGSAFWSGLLEGVKSNFKNVQSQVEAAGYLRGQQDSQAGKQRQDVHMFMEESYNEGYNRATVGANMAKFQTDLQQKAIEYVNAGRSSEEFNEYVQTQTQQMLSTAGEQGMDLNNADWQAWLNGVDGTRNTATDLYNTKSLERSKYMKQQALAAEGNAAQAVFVAADEAGNPVQAFQNLDAHKVRIYSDPTLTLQEKDGAFANFAMSLAASAKSSGAVEAVSSYLQDSPEYQRLPTEVQTQIMQGYQSQYNQRAADEVGGLYAWISEVRAVSDPTTLNQNYPMSSFIARVNEAQKQRQITPAQAFSLTEEEYARRLKGQTAYNASYALAHGNTVSEIQTVTGWTAGKVKNALMQSSAQANGGFSGGGMALIQRGLQSGAWDITTIGIEMMQQDAASLGSLDVRNLKIGPDGNPLFPTAITNSYTNLKTTYDTMMRKGNQAQADQLLAGLPDAVAYGIRQTTDARDVMNVIYTRANQIAKGGVVSLPATLPKEILATADDLTAGLFDTGLTENGQKRNTLGIQAYGFTSKEDGERISSRIEQVNGALGELYTSLYQQGRLPQLQGDDLKHRLMGMLTANTIRMDDGTDAGTLLILPEVRDKAAVFGTTDNTMISLAMKEHIKAFQQQYPGARQINLRYDSMSNELIVSGIDKNNVQLTAPDGILASDIRDSVRSQEAIITSGGRGQTTGNLSLPGVGMVKYNTANQYGVHPQIMSDSINRLVTYEGYTETKGYSILAVHPETGKPLNEAKYVKQPGDSPQMATDKFQSYINDKVLPGVMTQMSGFKHIPEYLQDSVFQQLVETTYHAGNANAFGQYVSRVLDKPEELNKVLEDFQNSPLYKDAGPTSMRNRDREAVLVNIAQYAVHQ